MDGAQLELYYEEQLKSLNDAIFDLRRINWNGLQHWLSAKATWTTPPIHPDQLEAMRIAAANFVEITDEAFAKEER